MKQCVDKQPCTRHYTPSFADHPGLMQFSYSQTSRYVIVTLDVSHAGSAPLSEVRFIHVHISTQSDKFAVYADARKWPNSPCMYTSRVFNQDDHLDMCTELFKHQDKAEEEGALLRHLSLPRAKDFSG